MPLQAGALDTGEGRRLGRLPRLIAISERSTNNKDDQDDPIPANETQQERIARWSGTSPTDDNPLFDGLLYNRDERKRHVSYREVERLLSLQEETRLQARIDATEEETEEEEARIDATNIEDEDEDAEDEDAEVEEQD